MIDTSKRLSILYSAAWTCVIGSAVARVSLVTVGVVCCHGGCVLTGLSIKETGVGGMSVDMSPISQTSPISMSPLSGSPLSAGVQATDGASDSVDPSVMLKIHSRRFRESVSSPVRCLRPVAVFTENFAPY